MLRLDGIAAFVAVVEGGSISEAARGLRLSKSVVSDRLAELERTLGADLLHRTTRRIELTEDGSAFLERARRILEEVSGAAADLDERRGTLSGPLRIAGPVTFGRRYLGPALISFLQANPAVNLTLDLDDRRVDVGSSGYDAIIRNGPIVDSRLIAWKLAESRRLLVAAPSYLARHGTPRDLTDLARHKGIFYTNRGVADWRFDTANGPVTVRADLSLGVNNGDVMCEAAIAGLGLALMPAFIACPAVRTGDLVEVCLNHAPEPDFLYMAHWQGRTPSLKLRRLHEHLRESFGSPPVWEREG